MKKNKPIILGLINPHETEDLDVQPKGCSGYRLYSMIRGVKNDFTQDDYMRLFDRRNLFASKEDCPEEAVVRFKSNIPDHAQVVLLGDVVRRTLQISRLLVHPQTINGVTYRQIPHPSGLTRNYNDPMMRWLVGSLLLELAMGDLPWERTDADT